MHIKEMINSVLANLSDKIEDSSSLLEMGKELCDIIQV